MKKNNWWIALMLCAVLLGGAVIGYCVGAARNTDKTPGAEQPGLESSTPTQTGSDTVPSASQESVEGIAIRTDYGTLYYPEQWRETLATTQFLGEAGVTVTFAASIRGQEYALFAITIGDGGGAAVGTLTDSEGTQRQVHLVMEELPEYPELSEGEQNRLYAMQEDLNYLIDNLK